MKSHAVDVEVHGPWSLAVSREFWEGFSPNALKSPGDELSAVFRADSDWSRAQARVTQHDGRARIVVSGDGDLDAEYLHAVAEAALEGRLDAADLRSADPERALAMVQEIKGIGPFAAELIVLRGANAPDILPGNERRLNAEISERYGPGRSHEEIAAAWRPYRTWAAFHLRATAPSSPT